jgi:hypothetical protein
MVLQEVEFPMSKKQDNFVGSDYPVYLMPQGPRQPFWFSPENSQGEASAGNIDFNNRKARAYVHLPAGQSLVLAECKGRSGIIENIWITIGDRGPKMLRGLKIEMYWDGHLKPAVSAPLGDFFGHMFGSMGTFDNEYLSSSEGRNFESRFLMPFRNGMKILLKNETDQQADFVFYTVEGTYQRLPASAMYFHAFYNQQTPTKLKEDFLLLPTLRGAGVFLGTTVGVIADYKKYGRYWWGEGEFKIWLDSDLRSGRPSLVGTGIEDYIKTAWGLAVFADRWQGAPVADMERGRFNFYRFHQRPIVFKTGIKASVQQIGHTMEMEKLQTLAASQGVSIYQAGPNTGDEPVLATGMDGLFERGGSGKGEGDWYAATSFFYLRKPFTSLQDAPALEQRLLGMTGKAAHNGNPFFG